MRNGIVLVEDNLIWKPHYEEFLKLLAPSCGWRYLQTFDNIEESVTFILGNQERVGAVVCDMRIFKTPTDFKPVDLVSEEVQGVRVIKRVIEGGAAHVRFVIATAFMAPGDPVKLAIEEAQSKFKKEIVGTIAKSIDPEEDIRKVLALLGKK